MSLFPSTTVSEQIVIPLTKIDAERRLIIGVAALEQPDLTNEIMDYATAKPAFEAWSKSFEAATGGLSKGNLRVMHQKTAVGRLDQIAFNDEAKQIEICAKVVDDNEWKKCLDGVYTGFSVGGGYAKKWDDPMQKGMKRYTPRVAEMSLVDSPCMPGARFAELLKADGMVEQIELHGRPADPPLSFDDLWKSAPAATAVDFETAWANRPQTFDDLMKFEPGPVGRYLMNSRAAYLANQQQQQNQDLTPAQKGAKAGAQVGALGGAMIGARKAGLLGAAVGALGGAVAGGTAGHFLGPKLCPTCGQAMPAGSKMQKCDGPVTFDDLAKADPNHDGSGKFAAGATAVAAGAAGVGAAAVAGQAKHHYDEAQKHLDLMNHHIRQAEMYHGKYLNTALSSRDRSVHADLSFKHQESADEARAALSKSYAKYHATVGARLLRGASRIGASVAHTFR